MFRKREDGIKNTMKRGKEDEKADFCGPAMCHGLRLRAGAAGTVLNVDLPKETLTEREAADRHISTRPEGLKVTRQSVIPWDDAGRTVVHFG